MQSFPYKLRCLTSVLVLGLLGAPGARADLVNGGFETGNFTGWQTIGRALVVPNVGSIPAPEGNFVALLTNQFSGGVEPAALNTFLGTTLPGNNTQGSGLAQTVSVNAGDVLSFQWKFLCSEGGPSDVNNDASFVAIVPSPSGPPLAVNLLADTFDPFGPVTPGLGFVLQTPAGDENYNIFSFTFATAGTFQIAVAVVDRTDTFFPPGLLVDNFQITSAAAVPEPGSLALLGIAVAGLAGYAYRRMNRARRDVTFLVPVRWYRGGCSAAGFCVSLMT